MNLTVTQQGSFTSAGIPVTLRLTGGVDWIKTRNLTQIRAQNANTGYEFFWQQSSDGQDSGLQIWEAFETRSNAGATATNLVITENGFNPLDATNSMPLPPIAITAISGANPPIVSTADTSDLDEGSIVELINVTGAQQLGGIYFTVDTIVPNTSFRLPFAPQIAAGTFGFYRPIPDDAIFYPRRRFITKLIPGPTTQVTESVTISLPQVPGNILRLIIPPVYGTISQNLNGVAGNVISVDSATNTVTLDIDSSNMGTFSFPTSARVPFTQAQVVPIGSGDDQLNDPNERSLAGATENRAAFGIQLDDGPDGPAGVEGDVIFWQAGTTFSIDTENPDIS